MAHIEVNVFLRYLITSIEPFYKQSSVLEIGSYDVNGSVRSAFKDVKSYIGVDIVPGPSVDVVSKGHQYESDTKFDFVLSVESFEHNSYWVDTFLKMVELADNNGVVIITCATKGRLEHGTYRTDRKSSPGTSSSDNSYYRNLNIDDFKKIPNFRKMFVSYDFYVNTLTKDLYFYGLKGQKKLDVKRIKNNFNTAVEKSMHVRKKNSIKNYLIVKFVYFLLSPLYLILSDRAYQNATFFLNRSVRRLLNLLMR